LRENNMPQLVNISCIDCDKYFNISVQHYRRVGEEFVCRDCEDRRIQEGFYDCDLFDIRGGIPAIKLTAYEEFYQLVKDHKISEARQKLTTKLAEFPLEHHDSLIALTYLHIGLEHVRKWDAIEAAEEEPAVTHDHRSGRT
jgi:hypothetical protein